ncbi:MAG TPA: ACP S-malonyltransferase [Clostridiaceae bacterium]|nr:ACP S-malonyltransferase [Clostridiaceae bacterium]
MGKLAFIFPGQGAQYVGMGKDIAEKYEKANAIFDEASEVLGFDIKKMIFEGSEEDLKITENTQPAILTASIACMQPLLEMGIKPDVTAGLSIGEYSALVAAGAFPFKDAVRLVRKRGKYMQEAVPLGVGTMAAIIGLESNDVINACKEASYDGIVEPANFNCPGQIVIAGEIKAVDKAIEICNQKGAKRAVKLQVSAPFHCSMMKPAGEKLALELDNVKINNLSIPVVSNVTAQYVTDSNIIKELLIKQVSSSVLWEDSVRTMINDGVDTFVEIGPGKTLTGFIRRISKTVKTYNIENLETLDIFIKEEVKKCN